MKKSCLVLLLALCVWSLWGCKSNLNEGQLETDAIVADKEEQNVSDGKDGDQLVDNEVLDEYELSEIDYKKLTYEYVSQMTELAFDQVYDAMSKTMQSQITIDDLESGYQALVTDCGQFNVIKDIYEEKKQGKLVLVATVAYEVGGVDITFIYKPSGEIDGLWITYAKFEMELRNTDQYEEIAISIGEEPYMVDGILTIPKGVEKPPVVILVHGSGTHDQDESVGLNRPFRDIAHGLAAQGVATIRYRERLLDYEELQSEPWTIENDLLIDAGYAISYASSLDNIDSEYIYVLGHSLGGMMAPKLATDYPQVKGIVSLAGSPRKLEDILVDQNDSIVQQLGDYTQEQIDGVMSEVRMSADGVKSLNEADDIIYFGVPSSYWVSLNQIDTPSIVENLQIPMLILQGEKDWQIFDNIDFVQWKTLLQDRENVSFMLYPNLNHLFMDATNDVIGGMYSMGVVDKQVITDIADWIVNGNIK